MATILWEFSDMKTILIYCSACILLAVAPRVSAQEPEKMSKDQWQQQINDYTAQRDQLSARVKSMTTEADSLRSLSTKLDNDYKKCLDDLYALVGSDAAQADAFRAEIDAAENSANELSRLADADLSARGQDVDSLAATVQRLWNNRLSAIPEFYDRLTALNDKVKSMQSILGSSVKTYTVGTWARDRDCLWNISKKPDIYGNAWLWPKIWQGNRDQIKDPDIIHRGQKLAIPPKGDLSGEEKTAARRYYSRRHR